MSNASNKNKTSAPVERFFGAEGIMGVSVSTMPFSILFDLKFFL
jgi:hypothetical protein